MKRETLPPVRRVLLLLLTLLLLPIASCLTPESVDCPPDLVCPAGQRCAANAPVCIKDDCGDGIRQASETCDDGNIEDGDGCSKTCKSDESCGNSIVDIMPAGGVSRSESCDDGNNIDGDGCSADCRSSELCGNSVVDKAAAEVCDDGNEDNGDGCSADCRSNERCGNGVVDKAIGEGCDDGNTTNGDGCNSDCHLGECGNSILDPGEQCDDGNTVDEDNCTSQCHFARCGDGFVTTGVEPCDPGPAGSTATCNFNCTPTACGDGIVNTNAGEVCDDGNNNTCGTCSFGCTQRQDVSRATARIIGVPYSALGDGETFTFNEGRTDKLVFEFNKWGELKDNKHIEVDINNRPESDLTAEAIQNTINYLFKNHNFEWHASDRLWNVVMLEHKTEGQIDKDKSIISGVSAKGFIVGITSHGSGYDCPVDMGCMRNEDCKSKKCVIPTGQVTRTCQP